MVSFDCWVFRQCLVVLACHHVFHFHFHDPQMSKEWVGTGMVVSFDCLMFRLRVRQCLMVLAYMYVFHSHDSQISEELVGSVVSMDCFVFSQTVFHGVFHGLDPQVSEEWVGCVVSMNC